MWYVFTKTGTPSKWNVISILNFPTSSSNKLCVQQLMCYWGFTVAPSVSNLFKIFRCCSSKNSDSIGSKFSDRIMVMTRSERHRQVVRTCDLSSETGTRVQPCSRGNIDTLSERGIRNPAIRAAASGATTERRRNVCRPSVASDLPSKRACVSPIEG